ncbi:RNA polymerase sigma factor [Horticoccus sp. 23ND18S-11]|uniref:RNA polymerase sigma factor n=1 Tax=Horticoccus sp. 23ND18S-11 TaxID=3391832 RepID=UPI0039C92D2C
MSLPPTTPDQITVSDPTRWFSEEVEPHAPALKGYIRRTFPRLHDVDDVVQESYLRLWRRRAEEPVRSVRAFLFAVAQHIAIDGLRRSRRCPIEGVPSLAALPVADDSPSVPERLGDDEKIALLVAAIDALPSRCRDVVVLRKLQLLSQRETAERLGISEKGVENQLARGLERCRRWLRSHGAEHHLPDGR